MLDAGGEGVRVPLKDAINCSCALCLPLYTVIAVKAVTIFAVLADTKAVAVKLQTFTFLTVALYVALTLCQWSNRSRSGIEVDWRRVQVNLT